MVDELKNGEPTRRGVAFWPGDGTVPARIFFIQVSDCSPSMPMA
jgi:hypothetical protein